MTTSSRVPETLAALREATGPAHEAIDRQLQLGADLTLDRYVRILQGFEGFLSAWEPAVAAVLPPEQRAWFSGRSRLAFVRQDLAALAPRGTPAPHPCSRRCTTTPRPSGACMCSKARPSGAR